MAVKERADILEALGRIEEAVDKLSLQELAERSGVDEDALIAFAETVGELMGERPLTVQTARRAALLAAAGQVWENELGPLLTSTQVRELMDGVSRQRVDELLRARRLIGLRDSTGRRKFPSFQLPTADRLNR